MPDVDVVLAQLSEDPISVDRATAAVQGDEAGAVVSFSGVVRNHDGGMAVSRLSYSAHPTAHHILAEVVTELVAEHAGKADKPVRIWAAHRVGMLQVGDPALVCAVSAAHRGQAFAVCSELVDRIKARVPIWKEQFFEDGTVEWVGAGQTTATRPTSPNPEKEHHDCDHFDCHFNNPVRCPRYVRRTL